MGIDVEIPRTGVVSRKQQDCKTMVGKCRLTKILADRSLGVTGLSICFVTIPPGGETEMHAKPETEVLFVVKGRMCVKTRDQTVTIDEGDSGVIYSDTLHSHSNPGPGWNQYLVILTPDGPEQSILERRTLEDSVPG